MELAIQKDCEALIERFILNENPRFESFVYQWKATMFQRIYTAQSISVEIIQSTNVCIHYAKRVLSYKSTLPKLGALFLLYAIHFKQPTDRFHKIDMDLTTWLKLKEFLFCLENMLCTEGARCIFWELMKEDAFRFVAADTYYGLENLINLDRIRNTGINLNKNLHIFRSDIKALTSRRGIFMGITKLEDGYNEMKELMNQCSSTGTASTMMPLSRNFEQLKTALSSLNSFISKNYLQGDKKEKKPNRKERVKKRGITKPRKKIPGRTIVLGEI